MSGLDILGHAIGVADALLWSWIGFDWWKRHHDEWLERQRLARKARLDDEKLRPWRARRDREAT